MTEFPSAPTSVKMYKVKNALRYVCCWFTLNCMMWRWYIYLGISLHNILNVNLQIPLYLWVRPKARTRLRFFFNHAWRISFYIFSRASQFLHMYIGFLYVLSVHTYCTYIQYIYMYICIFMYFSVSVTTYYFSLTALINFLHSNTVLLTYIHFGMF